MPNPYIRQQPRGTWGPPGLTPQLPSRWGAHQNPQRPSMWGSHPGTPAPVVNAPVPQQPVVNAPEPQQPIANQTAQTNPSLQPGTTPPPPPALYPGMGLGLQPGQMAQVPPAGFGPSVETPQPPALYPGMGIGAPVNTTNTTPNLNPTAPLKPPMGFGPTGPAAPPQQGAFNYNKMFGK